MLIEISLLLSVVMMSKRASNTPKNGVHGMGMFYPQQFSRHPELDPVHGTSTNEKLMRWAEAGSHIPPS